MGVREEVGMTAMDRGGGGAGQDGGSRQHGLRRMVEATEDGNMRRSDCRRRCFGKNYRRDVGATEVYYYEWMPPASPNSFQSNHIGHWAARGCLPLLPLLANSAIDPPHEPNTLGTSMRAISHQPHCLADLRCTTSFSGTASDRYQFVKHVVTN